MGIKKKTATWGLAEPVLDAFTDDEEVGLEEALDDLAVPLLSHSHLAGYGHTLATRAQINGKVPDLKYAL